MTHTTNQQIRERLLLAFGEPNDKMEYNGIGSTKKTDEIMSLIDAAVREARSDEANAIYKLLDPSDPEFDHASYDWITLILSQRIAELTSQSKDGKK